MKTFCARRSLLIPLALALLPADSYAEPVPVRHPQGSFRAFIAVKTLAGNRIATGDVTQSVHGDRVTARVLLRFRDGSIDDETTLFSQRAVFRLISDHHIQHGPSFPKPIDVLIDVPTGMVTSRGEDGKVTENHLDLPPDVSNGLPPILLMNILPSTPETKISFVAPGSKPRLVRISIKPAGEVSFRVGDTRRKAIDYVGRVELGGVTGLVAPILGKQPADYHIWVLTGKSPALIREEGQLYEGGPIWRLEQIAPVLPR